MSAALLINPMLISPVLINLETPEWEMSLPHSVVPVNASDEVETGVRDLQVYRHVLQDGDQFASSFVGIVD